MCSHEPNLLYKVIIDHIKRQPLDFNQINWLESKKVKTILEKI